MRASRGINVRWWPALLFPLVFFGLGLAVLPQVGLQQDEVLFKLASPDKDYPTRRSRWRAANSPAAPSPASIRISDGGAGVAGGGVVNPSIS